MKPHNFYLFVVESKNYTDLDSLRKHVRLSKDPIVKVYYCGLSGTRTELMEVEFFKVFTINN